MGGTDVISPKARSDPWAQAAGRMRSNLAGKRGNSATPSKNRHSLPPHDVHRARRPSSGMEYAGRMLPPAATRPSSHSVSPASSGRTLGASTSLPALPMTPTVRLGKLDSPGSRGHAYDSSGDPFHTASDGFDRQTSPGSQWMASALASLEPHPASPNHPGSPHRAVRSLRSHRKHTERDGEAAAGAWILNQSGDAKGNSKKSDKSRRNEEKSAKREVEEEDEDAPGSHLLEKEEEYECEMIQIEGGPTEIEMLSRLESGERGFDEPELKRMNAAFHRFTPAGSEGRKDDLPRILVHMNYVVPDDNLVTKNERFTKLFENIDFEDFEHFCMKFATVEKEQLRAHYDEHDPEKKEKVPCSVLPVILKNLGLVLLTSTIDNIRRSLRMEDTTMTFRGFLRFVAAYKSREGFMPSSVQKLRKVFNELLAEDPHPFTDRALKPSVSLLRDGMLRAFGVTVHDILDKLLESTYWEVTSKSPGITFHEFVVWAHHLQDIQIRKYDSYFGAVDGNKDSLISMEELFRAMSKFGFTLFSQTFDEIVEEIDLKGIKEFNFADFVSFVNACQKRDGFELKELKKLAEAYDRHDPGSGMDNFQVAGLLRYLGYDIQLPDVHRYMKQVDFNGDGAMDFGEFLRLMRIHREEELTRLKKIFYARAQSGKLNARDLERTCAAAGFPFEDDELKETLMAKIPRIQKPPDSDKKDSNDSEESGSDLGSEADSDRGEEVEPEGYDFERFIRIVDTIRERNITRKRQRAGFSDKEFALISNLWDKYSTGSGGKLDKGNIILLLIDAGVPMDQAAERARVFEMLGAARRAAIEAGIPTERAGRPTSARLTFWPLVHLLRALLVMGERNTVMREDQAIFETSFERYEVADFRDLFLECGRWTAHGDVIFEENDVEEPLSPLSRQVSPASTSNTRTKQVLSRRASLPSRGSRDWDNVALPKRPHDWAIEDTTSYVTLKDLLSGHVYLMRVSAKSIEVILTRKLKMKFTNDDREKLKARALEISENGEKDRMDFADFLRLMKWILDSNFAQINKVAENITQADILKKKEEARQRMVKAGLVVRSTIRMKVAMSSLSKRRRSI